MASARNAACVIGPVAFGVLVLYNFSVQVVGAPVPEHPWDKVLAVVLTALFLPWLVLAAIDWWAARRSHRP